jgi:epoxyqueuosine reductase
MTEAPHPARSAPSAWRALLERQARALGFSAVGVAGLELPEDERRLEEWLAAGRHGTMLYMAHHGRQRSRPQLLRPGTLRVISARMPYFPGESRAPAEVLADATLGYVSRYALGRDYHRFMRLALQKLARSLATVAGPHGFRVFVDTGPVLEKALARNAGLGWIGKHTNLIAREGGSWFFLGEIYTDLALAIDAPASAHCGSCTACIPACPTGAIVAPYQLDARRCIAYLTIELAGTIPLELRPAIGNRIYGCDDCQLACPWNAHATIAGHADFKVRHQLDAPRLAQLFAWTEAEFLQRMQGSAIHRIGHERWLRNIAVALGNGPGDREALAALRAREFDASPIVREHVQWALGRLAQRAGAGR